MATFAPQVRRPRNVERALEISNRTYIMDDGVIVHHVRVRSC